MKSISDTFAGLFKIKCPLEIGQKIDAVLFYSIEVCLSRSSWRL